MVPTPRIPLAEDEAWRVPIRPGVYLIFSAASLLLYVGKTTDLRERFIAHARGSHNAALARAVAAQSLEFGFLRLYTERELDQTERQLIRQLNPLFNRVRYRRGV